LRTQKEEEIHFLGAVQEEVDEVDRHDHDQPVSLLDPEALDPGGIRQHLLQVSGGHDQLVVGEEQNEKWQNSSEDDSAYILVDQNVTFVIAQLGEPPV
jgi:hypothetical protein